LSTKTTKQKNSIPKKQEWTDAVDTLFVQTEDKESVTVKEILQALEEKFDCKMTKKWKTNVRERLKALIQGKVKPVGVESDCEGAEQESEEEDADDEASVASDPGNDGSDYEDDKKPTRSKKSTRSSDRKTGSKSKKPTKRTIRLSKRKEARARKVMVETHKLRKKQLEKERMEEKVRNEEMQVNQSKEDQERAEAIAAKFETNTDELRLKRLEDRLDLLQRLDQKRISVVEIKEEVAVEKAQDVIERCDPPKEESESEESSSEEEDLVIVGQKKTIKPLKPLHNNLPSRGLSLLNEIRSPKNPKNKNENPGARTTNILKNNKDGMITSPGKSMGARFALRNALKQKQRKVGNRWLARELGYKTEDEHLKDCKTAAEQKRELVLKLEQERLKANERKQLRERLLLQDENGYNEPEADDLVENGASPDAEAEEEDEEMLMARALEEEAHENAPDASQEGDEPDEKTTDEIGLSEAAEETEPEIGDVVHNEPSSALNEETSFLETHSPELGVGHKGTNAKNDPPDPVDDLHAFETDLPDSVDDLQAFETQPLETRPSLAGNDESPSNTKNPLPTESRPSEGVRGHDSKDSFVLSTTEELPAPAAVPDESAVTPEMETDDNGEIGDASADEGELEFVDEKDPSRPRNAGWQAILKREAEQLKKQKKRKGGLVEEEAEEEEEEEVAGLEDFGFSVSKKKKDDDEEEDIPDTLDEDDLKHVVDDVSDGEGDEDAGMEARKRLEQREEKERHKEILRRMREGYDGRRGGIAGGGAGARGMHRFDQLVAADNREDAKRLGLLNDDELDSDEEKEGNGTGDGQNEDDDEAALLDKVLKDRFMHRSDVDNEDIFSDDEEDEQNQDENGKSINRLSSLQ
jgi:hypothetical protein